MIILLIFISSLYNMYNFKIVSHSTYPIFVCFSTYFDWCFYIASNTVINSGFHKVLFSSHKWRNFLEEKYILVKSNLSVDDERFGYIQCSA